MKIKYNDIEKAFILKSIVPFDILEDRELFNIANITTVKQFKSGDTIAQKDEMAHEIYIIIDGSLASKSPNELVKIIGIKSVLDDTALLESVTAGESGTTALRIGKGHFLTAIYECPAMLASLTEVKKIHRNYFI